MLSDFFENRLRTALEQLFGPLDDNTFSGIQTFFEWVDLHGGVCLFRQGDQDDSMYVVASGRLRVIRHDGLGHREAVAEIAAGETVGEMALITGEPRNADIVAMRDTVLARISKADFERLAAIYPQALLHISRSIIERLREQTTVNRHKKYIINLCLLPVSASIDKAGFTRQLREALSIHGEVTCIDSDHIDAVLDSPGIAQCTRKENAQHRRLTSWLEEQESLYRFVLYIPDIADSEWTHRCLRQADEVLLLGDSGQSPELHPVEIRYLQGRERLSIAGQTLALLHPPHTSRPTGTAAWIEHRPLNFHHHLRLNNVSDMARLARFLSGKAIGLVLSGGGSKGFAHIGVCRALEEAGITVDLVGGTSIGAIMGALVARGLDGETMRTRCREVFKKSPTGDINLVPRVSVFKAKKLESLLQEHFGDLNIEDCWLNFYCVSCNLTRNLPHVHRSGSLSAALRASISIPGVFPPAEFENELYVDGGVFDNMPVDEMNRLGAGTIIAVDLQMHREEDLTQTDVYRKRKLPNLLFVVMESAMLSGRYHAQTHRKMVDYYFNPPLQGISLIDWNKFDQVEHIGYQHAVEVLKKSEVQDKSEVVSAKSEVVR
ncbi:MAG: patatin-like phospholipase family protein [Lewinellaceae bacterium]|nr:patatin-like phospholipase family protein [Lewinellaceae bacterium]